MADGRTHEKYTRLLWYVITPMGLIWYVLSDYNWMYPIFLYLNFAFTDISSPDLDHSMITRDEHDAKRLFKKISPAIFIPKFILSNRNIIRKTLRKLNLGIIGALYVSWSQMFEYFASLFGGHRSWVSHGLVIGTITRMAWFNIPVYFVMSYLINYSIANWGTPPWDIIGFNYYWMYLWLPPYLITQAVAWFMGDVSHLILDTEYAKGRLYDFAKFGDKRGKFLKRIISMNWVHPPTTKRKTR